MMLYILILDRLCHESEIKQYSQIHKYCKHLLIMVLKSFFFFSFLAEQPQLSLYILSPFQQGMDYTCIWCGFKFYPDEKFSICRMYQNKQNHALHSILSFAFRGFLVFSTVSSPLPTTTTTSVVQESIYAEFHLLKGNPSVYFT